MTLSPTNPSEINPADGPASDREERLAAILAAWIKVQRLGEVPDTEKESRQYPELAQELRELWATVKIADDLARWSLEALSQAGELAAGPGSNDATLPASAGRSLTLPRMFGDYELLEELGRGGMGVVYKARQESLDRLVAVKMILRGELASSADVARFQAEAEAAGRLDHPNIVPVYEVGEHDGQPYFSMKFVDGTTLSERLMAGPLGPREIAALLLPVCRAIGEAHRQGILHRDLKPSNILLDREGTPHVTDFGLAKRIETDLNLTRSGAILGTPNYMAPEQAAGRRGQVSPASDVYSLGTILYHMLTGRPPFQAATPLDTVMMVLEQDPLPPRLLNPKADADLEMISLKCLQKPPDLRYSTAAALADDLDAYLRHEPIAARSGTIGQIVFGIFRETHHAAVLENWGLLWMWHSLVLLVICLATNYVHVYQLFGQDFRARLLYVLLWTGGLGAWAAIFWTLRRRAGPITFVERQIAHLWGTSIICSSLLFAVESMLRLPPLMLSPVLPLISGSVFFVKAGILSGSFYLQAAALFATTLPMALWPDYGLAIFGLVSALCFFLPGLKYHRQRRRHDSGWPIQARSASE